MRSEHASSHEFLAKDSQSATKLHDYLHVRRVYYPRDESITEHQTQNFYEKTLKIEDKEDIIYINVVKIKDMTGLDALKGIQYLLVCRSQPLHKIVP